jgi:hypothetical protein
MCEHEVFPTFDGGKDTLGVAPEGEHRNLFHEREV